MGEAALIAFRCGIVANKHNKLRKVLIYGVKSRDCRLEGFGQELTLNWLCQGEQRKKLSKLFEFNL
jgi:hypothetical protein